MELSVGRNTIKKTVVLWMISIRSRHLLGSTETNGSWNDTMAIEALTQDKHPIGGTTHLAVHVSDEKACDAVTGELLATPLVIVHGDGSTDCIVTVTLGTHSLERRFLAQAE